MVDVDCCPRARPTGRTIVQGTRPGVRSSRSARSVGILRPPSSQVGQPIQHDPLPLESYFVSKRVVVTGMGCVSPLGLDLETTWQAMLAGKSGVAPIQGFDATDHDVKIAAEIPTFDPTKIMNAKEARRIDRFIQLGMSAARAAFEDAGLAVTPENAERMGAISGSGVGGIGSLGNGFK